MIKKFTRYSALLVAVSAQFGATGCQDEVRETYICQTYTCTTASFSFNERLSAGNYTVETTTPEGQTQCAFEVLDAQTVADTLCRDQSEEDYDTCVSDYIDGNQVANVSCEGDLDLDINVYRIAINGTPSEASMVLRSGENCEMSAQLEDARYPEQSDPCELCDSSIVEVDTSDCSPELGLGGAGGAGGSPGQSM